jgi:hypothetical protein
MKGNSGKNQNQSGSTGTNRFTDSVKNRPVHPIFTGSIAQMIF